MHGADRRRAATLVPDCPSAAVNGAEVTTVEGHRHAGAARARPAGVHPPLRHAVRLLHARDAHRRPRATQARRNATTATRSRTRSRATSAAAPATSRSSTRCAAARGESFDLTMMTGSPTTTMLRRRRVKAVGARLPRYDGVAHVTGRTTFVDDVRVPGTLWAKALRSPVHHADITRLDTSKAEAMPGVHAVITWEDVPLLVVRAPVRARHPRPTSRCSRRTTSATRASRSRVVAAEDEDDREGGGRGDRARVRREARALRRPPGRRSGRAA